MDELAANIRAAIQQLLDADPAQDGWHVAQYVISMGLERVRDGHIEATSWLWAPPEQAEWMTDGLIDAAREARMASEIDDDDD